MYSNAMPLSSVPWRKSSELKTLVENRTTYTLASSELSIFETHQAAERVPLVFGDLVLTAMLKGKKVMHLFGQDGFDYLPGESVIIPPNEVMKIDFPEAEWDNPTQCIALSISKEELAHTFTLLNEQLGPRFLGSDWGIDLSYFHLVNNQELSETIHRFIRIGIKECSKEKDVIASLALKELLIRLTQTQAREMLERTYKEQSGRNRLAHLVEFVKTNIRENLHLETLASQACMSKAHFVRTFKQELGLTPMDFVLKERLKMAKMYLATGGVQIQEVSHLVGFTSTAYFIRAFKKEFQMTPKVFQTAGTAKEKSLAKF